MPNVPEPKPAFHRCLNERSMPFLDNNLYRDWKLNFPDLDHFQMGFLMFLNLSRIKLYKHQ